MDKQFVKTLDTPCVVIDLNKAKNNIENMQKVADESSIKLRPHIKTHKMPIFAKMQLACGAVGITCAKIGEAEIMANSGIDDIFIAYPIVGEVKLKKLVALHKKIKRLILAVDSAEGAQAINTLGKEHDIVFEVRMEVDTGAKRTGAIKENYIDLAKSIKGLENLNLTGIYTFKSLFYKSKPTTDKHLAACEEGELMSEIVSALLKEGIELKDVSAGSTPTAKDLALTKLVSEIRPGTYIFSDYTLYKQNVVNIEDIAARIYATVVSVPDKSYAIIDGGTKTFPMDVSLNTEPLNFEGYAVAVGREDLLLVRMNEEHGILTSKNGDVNLKVGEVLEFIPLHVCTAVNMQNFVYVFDGQKLYTEEVKARGALQ